MSIDYQTFKQLMLTGLFELYRYRVRELMEETERQLIEWSKSPPSERYEPDYIMQRAFNSTERTQVSQHLKKLREEGLVTTIGPRTATVGLTAEGLDEAERLAAPELIEP